MKLRLLLWRCWCKAQRRRHAGQLRCRLALLQERAHALRDPVPVRASALTHRPAHALVERAPTPASSSRSGEFGALAAIFAASSRVRGRRPPGADSFTNPILAASCAGAGGRWQQVAGVLLTHLPDEQHRHQRGNEADAGFGVPTRVVSHDGHVAGSDSPAPPATAWPFTAASSGFGNRTIWMKRSASARESFRCRSLLKLKLASSSARSRPAQNASPAPVRTTARTPASSAAARSASASAWRRLAVRALRTCGRDSVSTRTAPSRRNSNSVMRHHTDPARPP